MLGKLASIVESIQRFLGLNEDVESTSLWGDEFKEETKKVENPVKHKPRFRRKIRQPKQKKATMAEDAESNYKYSVSPILRVKQVLSGVLLVLYAILTVFSFMEPSLLSGLLLVTDLILFDYLRKLRVSRWAV